MGLGFVGSKVTPHLEKFGLGTTIKADYSSHLQGDSRDPYTAISRCQQISVLFK